MSNVFSGKKTAADKVEDDFLGGGGAMDTDIYPATIKSVYIGKAAASDARNVTFILDINGREVRQQIWVSNRSGGVTYTDKKTSEEKNLPGYNQVNSVCMLILGKELGDMVTEELRVNIYDYDLKKEIPQAVDCFSELHQEKIQVALQRQTVDKTKKNDNTGDYEPTGETRDQNEIIKFFPETKTVTISEVAEFVKSLGESFDDVLEAGNIPRVVNKMSDEHGVYAATWLERNKGQVYDKSTGAAKSEGKSFKSGADKAASTAKKTSLFDD